mmetsp:Transcript_48082/g.115568  ORF Transcript_48082/g.115568 Transcript_48082/m.115568 type:complete len:267 (-) Transcript_48082:327-1127(-)
MHCKRQRNLKHRLCFASCGGALAAVALEDHVDVAGRAQDHRTPLVDVGGHEVEHALHRAVEHAGGGDAARRLADERHREALVQHAQLAVGALLVCGVDEDAAVQDGAVHVAHHRADVSRGVLVLLAPVDVVEDGEVPVGRVALVARVDLLATANGELHVGVGVDELSKRGVEGEALDAATFEADDQLRRRAVHAVACRHDIVARAQDVRRGADAGRRLLIHGEDGAGAHVAVDVGRAVQRVEGDAEAAGLLDRHDDRLLVLLADED